GSRRSQSMEPFIDVPQGAKYLRYRNQFMERNEMKKSVALACLYLLMGCESSTQSPGNSPGLQVTLAKCQSQGAVQKIRGDISKRGKLIFTSSDSINFSIKAMLNCEAQYSFTASVIAPETLSMEAVDVGESRARCMCEKELLAQGKAMAGEDLSGIKFVKFATEVYELSAD
ncbi:MAG TPA: hypothetical protein VK465_15500, partial [Fibrobacteria bacterium]|nr:hypothetical protein [Fibrobacteria bacterium]